MDKHKLQQIEEYILGFFQRRQHSRILAKDLFDSTAEYANADLVRALEDLERNTGCWSATRTKVTTTFR